MADHQRADDRSKRRGLIVTLVGFALICALTLYPTSGHPDTPILCITCGDFSLVDAVLNIVLFVPLGVGLAMLGLRAGSSTLIGCVLSVAIESLQFFVIPGRDSTLRDVLTNTLGALVGALLVRHADAFVRPTTRQARVLATGAVLLWVGAHIAGDWLIQPSFAARRVLWGPPIDTELHESFAGKILGGSINNRNFPLARDTLGFNEVAMAQGRQAHLDIKSQVLAPPDKTSRIAPILLLVDPPADIQVLLGQRGTTLLLTIRSRAADVRLRPLEFELDHVFPGGAGSIGVAGRSLALEASYQPGSVAMSASSNGQSRTRVTRVGPALVWAMVLPFELPLGERTSLLAVLWLILTLFPIGFLISRAVIPMSSAQRVIGPAAVAVLLPGIVLVVLPATFGVAYGSLWEWMGAITGLLTGMMLAPLATLSDERAAFDDDSSRRIQDLSGLRANGGVVDRGRSGSALRDRLGRSDATDQPL
jgi:VanZ like protein